MTIMMMMLLLIRVTCGSAQTLSYGLVDVETVKVETCQSSELCTAEVVQIWLDLFRLTLT
jgi:hypothetical protein